MATFSEKKIRESLYAQLRDKGADVAHFQSLVEDYIYYFKAVKTMKKDVKQRGLSYPAVSAAGKEYMKDNPNVKLIPQYTKTMLAILRELGLTTDKMYEDMGEL